MNKGTNKIIITVYTKPACIQCEATKKHLRSRGVEFSEVSLISSEAALVEVKALGYLQAPVIVVNTDNEQIEHWGGYRPDLIEQLTT